MSSHDISIQLLLSGDFGGGDELNDRVAATGSMCLMLLAWSRCLPPACPVNTNIKLPDCYGRWQIDRGQKGLCVFREVMMCVFRDFK